MMRSMWSACFESGGVSALSRWSSVVSHRVTSDDNAGGPPTSRGHAEERTDKFSPPDKLLRKGRRVLLLGDSELGGLMKHTGESKGHAEAGDTSVEPSNVVRASGGRSRLTSMSCQAAALDVPFMLGRLEGRRKRRVRGGGLRLQAR